MSVPKTGAVVLHWYWSNASEVLKCCDTTDTAPEFGLDVSLTLDSLSQKEGRGRRVRILYFWQKVAKLLLAPTSS